jgi:tetratricopeptide (TPR) repeat protein
VAAAPGEPEKPEAAPAGPAETPDEPAVANAKPARPGKAEPKEPASESSGREPKDYAGWVGRGEQLFSRGDLSGARQAFETAVGLRASGSEANSGLGSVLLGMGLTREAIPFLSRAASNGFAEASVGLGDAHRKLGQKDEAIEAYETYLARLPKGARANYVRLQLEGLGRDSKPKSEAAPSAGPGEYRPAGEMAEPPAATPEPSAPAPSAGTESETTP